MLNRRAAAEEFVTLRMLNDNPDVSEIRLLRASRETRASEFEVLMRSGEMAGELRQIEVQTITRSSWDADAGAFVDRAAEALRENAVISASYAKLRRSRIRNSYLKRQVYDRGYIEVHIWGDSPERVVTSDQIVRIQERMRRQNSNIEGVYVNWHTNGEPQRLFIGNPRYRWAGLE